MVVVYALQAAVSSLCCWPGLTAELRMNWPGHGEAW